MNNLFSNEKKQMYMFIMTPKELFTNPDYKSLSCEAKTLYGLFLSRMSLSKKNNWFDKNKQVYIYYPIQEIQSELGFSKQKSINLVKELEDFNLVKIKRQGQGKSNKFYLVDFGSFIS